MEQIIHLKGDFDAAAFCRVREVIRTAAESASLVLDFHDVRWCQPFALAELFSLLGNSGGKIRARALCRQNELLLGYLGLSATATVH